MLFLKRRWPLLVLVLALCLEVLAFRWLGYDFAYLPSALIGDEFDTRLNHWVLRQAIENLTYRPFDLGYSPMLYGESAPFAATIAPYGIAILTTPLYFLLGWQIILTYNLYLLALFPLNAWAMALYVRQLIKAPPVVSGLAGLMFAFSPFHFHILAQIEILSSYLVVLTLLLYYRLEQRPALSRSIGLAVTFSLTATTSGYLAVIALSMLAVMVAWQALVDRRMPERAVLWHLVFAGVASAALIAPFFFYRLAYEGFQTGRDASTVLVAPIRAWLAGNSLLYYTLFKQPLRFRLFQGMVLPLLAGWAIYQDRQGAGRSSTSIRLYTLLAGLGYLLSAGLYVSIREGVRFPMPFLLISRLPVLNVLRDMTHFLLIGLIFLCVLAARGLTDLWQRFPAQRVSILVCIVLLFYIESIPYPLRHDRDVGRAEGTLRLAPIVLEQQPVYTWLAEQPAGTPVFHYPHQTVNVMRYLGFQEVHHQPMFGGASSLMPGWYSDIDWGVFPSAAIMGMLHARSIRYVIFHEEEATPETEASFMVYQENYTAQWGEHLLFVSRIGQARVYRIQVDLPDAVFFGFDSPLPPGTGWGPVGRTPAGDTFRWMVGREATVDALLKLDDDAIMEAKVLRASDPALLEAVRIQVNGIPMEPQVEADPQDGAIYRVLIPAATLQAREGYVRVAFIIQHGAVLPDQRTLAVDWLRLTSMTAPARLENP